jgi:hypothetical protein
LKASLVAELGRPDNLRTNCVAECPPALPWDEVGARTGVLFIASLPTAVYYCFISILNNYYIKYNTFVKAKLNT